MTTQAQPSPIKFYSSTTQYSEFSNFYRAPFEALGLWWPTNEHFYQAQKFWRHDRQYALFIHSSSSASIAAARGRSPAHKPRTDWDSVKLDFMYIGVSLKFRTNPVLAALLMSTGNALLQEDSPRDYFWGIGTTGKGHNHLGLILMKVREEIVRETELQYANSLPAIVSGALSTIKQRIGPSA